LNNLPKLKATLCLPMRYMRYPTYLIIHTGRERAQAKKNDGHYDCTASGIEKSHDDAQTHCNTSVGDRLIIIRDQIRASNDSQRSARYEAIRHSMCSVYVGKVKFHARQ